jgi:anthraniloyl-CoA monooxygenase
MRIAVIGGGPAGLYFSILMRQQDRRHEITVFERNRPSETFGWGVVFSDRTLDNLAGADPETQVEIRASLAHWDDIDVHIRGRVITSSGHGFSGIERRHLLEILQRRAAALGVQLVFEAEVETPAAFPDADLIVAADGINSRARARYADHFQPEIERRNCRYVWLGTTRPFEAFTFAFEQTEWGWFQAHAYRFKTGASTFIVETPEAVWRAAGVDRMAADESIRFCERLFTRVLDGHRLLANLRTAGSGSIWVNFPRVANRTWVKDNLVLMGDAAHSAHFSIGSGTKMALEDAIALARHLGKARARPLQGALQDYEAERKIEVLKLQSAARNSTEWFENVGRYAKLPPEQFVYSLLTRSQRVSHENLRLRDKAWLEGFERWFAEHAGRDPVQQAIPPMFTPFRLRAMTLRNRVVVSPMAMYSAVDGVPGELHLVHLGARALGGAGLIFTEMTCVSPTGRITPGCAGLWNDEQAAAWTRIVDFVHAQSPAKVCLQLGHSGPKGSTRLGWEGMDRPLADENWEVIGPSPVRWSAENQVPRAVTRADMDEVTRQFVAATRRAICCGFDMLELHCAHGYLLSAFISPLSNRRTDVYGGPLANRLRFPLEVFAAMREIWPQALPMSVRISATDWHPEGLTPEDAIEVARAFKQAGADLIDVSAGQTTIEAKPIYGRMFQTPFSDRIRNEVGIATMAVGNIFEVDHVNSIIAAGRADLCALARPHLADPFWTLHAAAELGYDDQAWPLPYLAGREQYLRNRARRQDAEAGAI